MGMRMFEEGEANWPEDAPFHAPVFVLTHHPRPTWERKGGTTFTFATDGIESSLRQARIAARGKDVRIAGGAETIHQFLAAHLVDEIGVSIAPMVLGAGLPLFKGVDGRELTLEPKRAVHSPMATHLEYRVKYNRPG